MPRRKTVFYREGVYHIMNRGSQKLRVFETRRDCELFEFFLEFCAKRYNVAVIAHCIMPNHFHLLVRQESAVPIWKFVQVLSHLFSCHYNKENDRVGTVFQGRFTSEHVESQDYLHTVLSYIHLNPVKANLCAEPGAWPFSNYKAFIGLENDTITSHQAVTRLIGDLEVYKSYLNFYRERIAASRESVEPKDDKPSDGR